MRVSSLSIYFWNKSFFIKWLSQIASPARLGSFYLLILIYFHELLSIGAGHFVIKHTTYEIEYKQGALSPGRLAKSGRPCFIYVQTAALYSACAFQLIGNDRPLSKQCSGRPLQQSYIVSKQKCESSKTVLSYLTSTTCFLQAQGLDICIEAQRLVSVLILAVPRIHLAQLLAHSLELVRCLNAVSYTHLRAHET